jgi:sec-independent protein translocase protein TatC
VSQPDEHEIEASRAPLLEHLVELRSRLIVCVAALVVGFLICFTFSMQILETLMRPYEMAQAVFVQQSHAGGHKGPFDLLFAMLGIVKIPNAVAQFIATAPMEVFFAKLKMSLFGAIVITFPVIAWQLYRFVAPGLYRRERAAFLPFLIAAPVLFVLGGALVYFVMLPMVLWFSLSQQIVSSTVQVTSQLKVEDYLTLVTHLLLAFGLCFQLPVILSLAGLAGLVNGKMLAKGRRYAIVGIVVVAAVVTPPDPISQCLLAIPIYMLYEISIWCVRVIQLRRDKAEALDAAGA